MSYDPERGHLCHKNGDDHLAYAQDGHLIYKDIPLLGWANITIEWFHSDRDLDILGFWEDDPGRKVGWNQGYSGPYETGIYQSRWSGDNTSEAGAEVVGVFMKPWTHNGSRRYRLYFNFYGEGSSCNVYVEQNGKTLYKSQSCGSRKGNRAETSDPGCVNTFGRDGTLLSLV